MLIRRGDILLVNFAPAREHEANYTHPAVVVTNNVANANAYAITVVPITSNITQVYPHDLFLPVNRSGLNKDSKAQVSLIRAVDSSRVIRRLSYLPDDLMLELSERLKEHLALG